MSYDILVIGAGPAGLSAALQARVRGKSVLVVAGDDRDNALYKAHQVDNYLGLPGLTGAELLDRFAAHARETGVERRTGRVLGVMPVGDRFYVSIDSDMEEAGAVILALGVSRGKKYPGEAEFLGRGVSYCATCDGALYREKRVAVVGLSADAPEEAAFLKQLGCQVTYVAAKRPEHLENDIPFVKGVKLEIRGEKAVTVLEADGEEIPCDGVFLLRPSLVPADLLPGLETDGGYITADRDGRTNIPGVFAAGDCTGLPLQVSKAVGEGLVAGLRAAEYLDQTRQK